MTANTANNGPFQSLQAAFSPLYCDLETGKTFPQRRPLLAHYTSTPNLERILASKEMWFSHPLLMNDLEELRFGVLEGAKKFHESSAIAEACGSAKRKDLLFGAFEHFLIEFNNKHAFDVYALCMAEHAKDDNDGLLSMWRGYGGNGNGAAIVIDTAKINPTPNSPLIISNVEYASTDKRRKWLDARMAQFADILKNQDIPDELLHFTSWIMFERLRLFALFSKHIGFSEEREWRVVYLRERDTHEKLVPMLNYAVTSRGLEPRLKFQMQHIDGITSPDFSMTKLIDRIILGPTANSPLAVSTLHRVMEATGNSELKDRVVASSIPYRS